MELYTKSWIDEHGEGMEGWKRTAFAHFGAMLSDREQPYPCIPGKQGFHQDNLRFGFAEDPTTDVASVQLATLLKQYGEVARETGKYASLVVFLTPRRYRNKKPK
ncbi:YqcI/YcgG family protein [Pseudalkalibacillus sp. NRS-1564]|uniref:YqcI/YcgG family protein n=1 Tax=Pseudalkalibacillus sp. NRS-1564 TaxID=3233900 RepID=UPI003D26691C